MKNYIKKTFQRFLDQLGNDPLMWTGIGGGYYG